MEQLKITLDRLTKVVVAEGGGPGNIVKITTFVTSMSDWQKHSQEQAELFAEFFQELVSANRIAGLLRNDPGG